MLNRIDLVYRFCIRFNHEFMFPDIRSNLHGQDYSKIFGLDEVFPNVRNWAGEVVRVPLSRLMVDDIYTSTGSAREKNALVEVEFEHAIAEQVIARYQLRSLEGFNYQEYLSKIFSFEKKVDYLIHLRLGDNYAYLLPNGKVFDSGRRRIVEDAELCSELLSSQWSIQDVLDTCAILEGRGASYCIHCDGIESVVKHIRWHKDPSYDEHRALLLPAVESFYNDFLMLCRNLRNLNIATDDVRKAVQDLLWSRNLIYTGGGFVRAINRLWNVPPVPAMSIKDFLHENLKDRIAVVKC